MTASKHMAPKKLDEEGAAILRQILERQVYRQLMAANIRGHGLKFVPDPGRKQLLVRDLHDHLSGLEKKIETIGADGRARPFEDDAETPDA